MISVDIQPFQRQLILMMDVVRENVGYTQQTNWIDSMEEILTDPDHLNSDIREVVPNWL